MTEYQRKWIRDNPERVRAIRKRYYRKNRRRILDAKKEYDKAWFQSNKAKMSSYQKKYRSNHLELVRIRNRNYMRRNKEKCRQWDAVKRVIRRSRLLAVIEDCSEKLRLLQLERFCRWCCDRLTSETFSVDHVIPLARGGFHVPENLAASCITCNKSKNDKLVSEWLPQLRLKVG